MDQPPRRHDRLTLAVLGGALVLIVAIGGYLVYSISRQAAPEAPSPGSFRDKVGATLKEMAAELRRDLSFPKSQEAPKPAAGPPKPQPPAAAAKSSGFRKPYDMPEAGRTWTYSVRVEPEAWKDVTLVYRTRKEGDALAVQTDFVHAGGKSAFNLGIFATDHPSHANTRFPGFFFYAAYLGAPLAAGQPIAFGWRWQGGNNSPARQKRFEGRVVRWEEVELKAGRINSARIEGTLSYVEDGKVVARAQEVFWYAPRVSQVVKIERNGRVPDEGVARISAELLDYR